MSKQACPIVGIPACMVLIDERPMHRVGEKYITCVVDGAGCAPLLVPAMGEGGCFQELVSRLDGLFLTGAASNVDPEIYDGEPSRAGTLHDPARDATTLPLITAAIEVGVPVFAVCRGIQELNVALGGTLHQNVHELPGKNEHRMNRSVPSDDRFEPRHPVIIQQGGMFEEMLGGTPEVMVNSLHAQAIDRPADGLFVEAISDDGVIEAVSMRDSKGLVVGVQWHPEHPIPMQVPLNNGLFRTFGDACRARMSQRSGNPSTVRAA